MTLSLVLPAFFAGILSFLAPCTLPLVPGYLAFVAGVSEKDADKVLARRKIMGQSVFFVVGFSAVFVLFGALAGFIGGSLSAYREVLARLGGVVVILFGLFLVASGNFPRLSFERHINMPNVFRRGTPVNSFLLGFSFGLGWTPCIGPILGAVLTIAFVKATMLSGAFLLSVFSLGLAIPFLTVSFLMGRARTAFETPSWLGKPLQIAGGLFLVAIGILLVLGDFGLLSEYFLKSVSFIDYGWLLNRL